MERLQIWNRVRSFCCCCNFENEEKGTGPTTVSPLPGQFPWLVYYDGDRDAKQIFYSLIPGVPPVEIFCKRIPSLEQKKILSCSYGWLVLYDFPNQLFSLCNCTTFDTTPLPKLCLGPPNMINSCILSSSPNSPDCKVLLFLKNRQSIMCCYVWDNTWREITYENPYVWDNIRREIENPKRLCFSPPVMCRGKIYAILRGQLWSIEIVNDEQEQIIWSKLRASRLREEYAVEEYVVESDGELYSISFIMANGNFVAVDFRKLSWDSMDWEIVDSLRNRSFFICPDYCFSCSTPGHDLIFLIKSGDVNIYTYNMEEDSLSVTKMKNYNVLYSNHGWVLMGMRRPRASDIHLYNPFTRDIQTYPSLGGASSVLFFASKPSFMLIGLSFFPRPCVSILEPAGKKMWTRSYVNAFPGIHDFRARAKSPSPVFFKGAFYSLNKSGNLARLYLNGEKFRWEVVVNVLAPCGVCPQNFLDECGGALLSVFVGHMGKRIYVFKLNISKRIWETVKSLNCYNLYLSQPSSFSLEASPGLANRIYFPRYRDGGTVFYSLERAEWSCFGSQKAWPDFYDTQLQLHSCWIKPSWC